MGEESAAHYNLPVCVFKCTRRVRFFSLWAVLNRFILIFPQKMFKSVLLIFSFCLIFYCDSRTSERLKVQLPDGSKILGRYMTSDPSNRVIRGFMGIPYAEKPIGDLRFKVSDLWIIRWWIVVTLVWIYCYHWRWLLRLFCLMIKCHA